MARFKKFLPLGMALLLAFAVRSLPASYNFVIGTDEALYLTLGGHLAAGDGFTADGVRPHSEFDPGYPLFAALVYRLLNLIPFSPSVTANDVWLLELPARLNLLLLGSLLAVPIYFLARVLEPPNRNLPTRAALLTAAVPALVLGVPNFEAASEQLYSLALWTGWLCLWLALTRQKWYWFVASGIGFGLAHLTRWEGLVSAGIAMVVTAVWFAAAPRQARQTTVGDSTPTPIYAALLSVLLLVGGVLLLAAPYALYQIARTGSVFSTKSIVHQLHGEALASPDPFAWEKSYANYELVRDNPGLYPPLPVYLWEHRAQTALLYARNTVGQLRLVLTSPTFLFILWLPFAILGALKFKRAQNLFLAATLAPALVFPLSVIDGRYLLPLLPAAMLWAARGLGVADHWLNARLTSNSSRFSFLAALLSSASHLSFLSRHLVTTLLVILFIIADVAALFFIPRPVEFRTAGLALRGVLPPQAPVLMRKRQFAFYANVAYESLPFSDLQGVLDYARKKNADYIELDTRTTPSTRPELVYLLDAPPPTNLDVLYKGPDMYQVIVYRILR